MLERMLAAAADARSEFLKPIDIAGPDGGLELVLVDAHFPEPFAKILPIRNKALEMRHKPAAMKSSPEKRMKSVLIREAPSLAVRRVSVSCRCDEG